MPTTWDFLLSGAQVQATSNSQNKYCVTAQHCWRSLIILMFQPLAFLVIKNNLTLCLVNHENATLLSQEAETIPGQSETYLLFDVIYYSTKMHYPMKGMAPNKSN